MAEVAASPEKLKTRLAALIPHGASPAECVELAALVAAVEHQIARLDFKFERATKDKSISYSLLRQTSDDLSQALCRAAVASAPSGHLAGRRVLVADSQLAGRESVSAMLQTWGMECAEVASGQEALTQLREASTAGRPFALLLWDQHLPDLSLDSLLEQFQSLPATPPRVVLMSGAAGGETGPSAKGVFAQLTKPVKQSHLFEILLTPIGTDALKCATGTTQVRLEVVPPPAARNVRVLVAEDHDINRRVVVFMLDKLGYPADYAANGNEVLKAWDRTSYDVILMDCQMPVLDGYAATREIRRREAQHPGVRRPAHIIAMTANAMQGDREKCFAAGMNDYISKPILFEALEVALNEATAPAGTPPPLAAPLADRDDLEVQVAALRQDFGTAAAAELLGSFLADTPLRLAELRQLAGGSNLKTFGLAAHSLAGSAGIFGLNTMRSLGLQLQDLAERGSLAGLEPLLLELENRFQAARPAVERLRQAALNTPAA